MTKALLSDAEGRAFSLCVPPVTSGRNKIVMAYTKWFMRRLPARSSHVPRSTDASRPPGRKFTMTLAIRLTAAALSGLLAFPMPVHAQQQLPAQLQSGPASEVPVATQVMRWRMNDADVNRH